jgi:hypothetical protein
MTGRRRQFADDELHWYALDVIRQKEYVAGHIFNRAGCMTLIPTEMHFRKKNRYSKGKVEAAHAALPGTVFVGFPAAPDWYRVSAVHLVNGVLSLDDKPHRIDTSGKEWMAYRAHQLDGCLTIERQMVTFRGQEVERSAALIKVQGRGVIRSHANMKAKASSDRPVVIRAAGERARVLGAILGAQNRTPQPLLAAA